MVETPEPVSSSVVAGTTSSSKINDTGERLVSPTNLGAVGFEPSDAPL